MTRLLILSITATVLISSDLLSGAEPPPKPGQEPAVAARATQDLILDAILRDVVSNPALKDEREFYGVAGDKQIALVTNSQYGIPWPKTYDPRLEGFTIHRVREDADDEKRDEKPRMLGLRIDKMNLKQKDAGFFGDAPIEVTILNGGGTKDGIIVGGCSVYYVPKRKGDHWTVKYSGSMDP